MVRAQFVELPALDRRGTTWAAVIAILFAALAAFSFAVDQSLTLADPGSAAIAGAAGH